MSSKSSADLLVKLVHKLIILLLTTPPVRCTKFYRAGQPVQSCVTAGDLVVCLFNFGLWFKNYFEIKRSKSHVQIAIRNCSSFLQGLQKKQSRKSTMKFWTLLYDVKCVGLRFKLDCGRCFVNNVNCHTFWSDWKFEKTAFESHCKRPPEICDWWVGPEPKI